MADRSQVINKDVAWEAAHLTNEDINRKHLHGQDADRYSELVGDIAVDAASKIVQAEKNVSTDLVTGLPSRRAVLERLDQEFSKARRHGRNLTVVFLDIDGFKQINEAGGHSFGDVVLKSLADNMRKGVRDEDFLGRYGGDEFIMILPESDEEVALIATERVLKTLTIQPVYKNKKFRLGGSFGLIQLNNWADKGEDLILQADWLMKKAKEESRNIRRQEAILGCVAVGKTIIVYNRAGEVVSEKKIGD